MNTELNEAAEKYANEFIKLDAPIATEKERSLRRRFFKEIVSSEAAKEYWYKQFQSEQNQVSDEITKLAIESVFELDEVDENWINAVQFSNGEIVKMLRDFALIYSRQKQ